MRTELHDLFKAPGLFAGANRTAAQGTTFRSVPHCGTSTMPDDE